MKKSLLLVLTVIFMMMAVASVFAVQFSDVENHWAEKEIIRWANEGVVNGYSDGTFKPNKNITRAEFVTMVVRMFDPTSRADISGYLDIPEDAWYYDAMAKAVNMGAIQGSSSTKMNPDKLISRQEAIVILNRILKIMADEEADSHTFVDSGRIASWARESIVAFVSNEYVNGYSDGSIRPTDNITRAEVVSILSRAIGMIITEPGTYDLSGVKGCVIVKAEGVTLQNAEDNNLCVTNHNVLDELTVEDKTEEEIVVIEDLEKAEEPAKEEDKPSTTGGGGGGSTTVVKKLNLTLTPENGYYRISKKGNGDLKAGTKLTIEIDNEGKVTTLFKDLTISKTNFATFKDKVGEAFDEGVIDEEMVIATLNDVYGDNEKVRAWGKKTATSTTLTPEELAIVDAYMDALSPEERAVILDLYDEFDAEEGRIASVALKELTYEEALELAKEIIYDYVPENYGRN